MIDERWRDPSSSNWPHPSSSSASYRRPDLSPGERLVVVETRQDYHADLHQTTARRLESGDSRMSHIEDRVDKIIADRLHDAAMKAQREIDKQHRAALRRDAIRGAALVLTALAFLGALAGKVPWEIVKSMSAGALGK